MTQFVEKTFFLTLRIALNEDKKTDFTDWQARFNAKVTGFVGFISLEFLSPTSDKNEWLIIQRFQNEFFIEKWKYSDDYQLLISDLKSCSKDHRIYEEISDESSLEQGVTEIFIAHVRSGKEKDYLEWSSKIHKQEALFLGFRGVHVQSLNQTNNHWLTLLQFDTKENLDRWLVSKERLELINQSEILVSTIDAHRIMSPYAGWFSSIVQTGEIPPVWKQTMIVLLILFPIVMIELKYLSPLLDSLNFSLSTFIGNVISVSLISFPFTPLLIPSLSWWLIPKESKLFKTFTGTLLILLLYAIEVTIFWNFF